MLLKIKRHRKIEFFNSFSLFLKYDSVASAFSFSFYFDPDNEEHKVLFQPSHYHKVDVEHNGELILRGTILNQGFSVGAEKKLATISGYSLPGVLEDCEIPTSLYPLQSDGRTLLQIAQRFTSLFPFNVLVDPVVSAKVNSTYDTSTASETQTLKGYLTELATQKKVILSHNSEGNLLFTEAKTNQKPFYHFENGMPDVEMSLNFDGQSMHSHITVQKQAGVDGGNAGEVTIRNPYVPYVYRPKVLSQSSGDDIDTSEAARMALSAELKGIVLTITTNVWEIDGKLIKPNSIVTVTNKELYLYNKTRWFVESIQFNGNETSTTAVLTCVLPYVYNNETVINIFEGMTDWRKFHRENHIGFDL